MAKKEKNTVQINKHPNAITVRGENREISIIKQKPSKNKFATKNLLVIKSLTKETGYNMGVSGELSENGKIKTSFIGLSLDALIELYACIGHYLNGVSDNSINYKKEKDV